MAVERPGGFIPRINLEATNVPNVEERSKMEHGLLIIQLPVQPLLLGEVSNVPNANIEASVISLNILNRVD